MSSDYDTWLQTDSRREAAERCEEGQHAFMRNGYCRDCGEEAELPPERDDPYDTHRNN